MLTIVRGNLDKLAHTRNEKQETCTQLRPSPSLVRYDSGSTWKFAFRKSSIITTQCASVRTYYL